MLQVDFETSYSQSCYKFLNERGNSGKHIYITNYYNILLRPFGGHFVSVVYFVLLWIDHGGCRFYQNALRSEIVKKCKLTSFEEQIEDNRLFSHLC